MSDIDATRAFQNYPVLGQKFNDTLKTRDQIAPHAGVDRMIAVRIDLPAAKVDTRKRMLLRIEDVDGTIVEIPERK